MIRLELEDFTNNHRLLPSRVSSTPRGLKNIRMLLLIMLVFDPQEGFISTPRILPLTFVFTPPSRELHLVIPRLLLLTFVSDLKRASPAHPEATPVPLVFKPKRIGLHQRSQVTPPYFLFNPKRASQKLPCYSTSRIFLTAKKASPTRSAYFS